MMKKIFFVETNLKKFPETSSHFSLLSSITSFPSILKHTIFCSSKPNGAWKLRVKRSLLIHRYYVFPPFLPQTFLLFIRTLLAWLIIKEKLFVVEHRAKTFRLHFHRLWFWNILNWDRKRWINMRSEWHHHSEKEF